MADATEYEESVVHHYSTLSASFDNVRGNVQQEMRKVQANQNAND